MASNLKITYNLCCFATILLITLAAVISAQENEQISNYIRKCCIGGLRHAKTRSNCDNYEYEVPAIPPLWRGLCHSTYGVCCSREIEQQHCDAGRLAALTGSRCNEQQNTTAYADCCRSCQVGLAVKASENDCNDGLFSYFAGIESYRLCCNTKERNDERDNLDQPKNAADSDSDALAAPNPGIIVLPEDDDDICGKVPNLCAHICENTSEAYRCKCNPGYKLDENNVTCSQITVTSNAATESDGKLQGTNTDDDVNDDGDSEEDEEDTGASQEDSTMMKRCTKGYEYDNPLQKCVDIDECINGQANCSDNQYCHNTIGSFHCLNVKIQSVQDSKSCETGYRFNMSTKKCEDINECSEKTDNCGESHLCVNTKGKFICRHKGILTDKHKCKPGFVYNVNSRKCEDYNECDDHPCDNNTYVCVNYPGSYVCEKRRDGLDDDDDDDDDNDGGDALHDKHVSKSKLAQSEIKCGDGFESKNGRCIDIDECTNNANACQSSQICTNDIGGFHCDCKIGFNLDATLNDCVDINECSINNHNCLPTQRCDNTVGSYICTRLQSCGTGYTLNAETGNCDDDDECALNTHNCPTDYACYNTKGSFRCYKRLPSTTTSTSTTTTTTTTTTAPPPKNFNPRNNTAYTFHHPSYVSQQTHSRNHHSYDYMPKYGESSSFLPCEIGFQRNRLGACVDINECVLNNPCGSHQRCANTNGSYRCHNLLKCNAGYMSTPDGKTCSDIDECETGEHNCADNQICHNRNGGFICSCQPGHQMSRLPSGINRCVDINECEHERPQVCPSNAQCSNTIGSYYCECKAGFKKSPDNEHICLDVDECQEIPGLCHQKCENNWGSYRCTCQPGYELSLDNRNCNDLNECDEYEVHKSYKLCMGYCNNVPGSYECSCPRGYTLAMDKTTCRDIDECSTGDFCTGRNDICTNTRGSYRCTTIQCPYGYVNDPDQKNRCRQTNNPCEGDDCYNKPSAYTYNFITLVSKLMIPPNGRVIFTLRGPTWYDDMYFDMKIVRIQAAANIEKATDNHFDTIKTKNEVHLSIKRSLEGPQDIELELSMTVFTNGMPRGKIVTKVFILVSQHTF